jgi:hypothetical protein
MESVVGVVGLGSVALGSGDVCQRERVDLIWDVAGPVPISHYPHIPFICVEPRVLSLSGDDSLISGYFFDALVFMIWFCWHVRYRVQYITVQRRVTRVACCIRYAARAHDPVKYWE